MYSLTNFRSKVFSPVRPIQIGGQLIPFQSIIENIYLRHIEVRMEHEEKKYSLPEQLASFKEDLVELHRTDRTYNGALNRLNHLRYDFIKRKLVINTSKTSYFDSLASNYSLDLLVGNKTIRDLLIPAQLSNHFGVSALLISSDGKMIFQQRSNEVKDDKGQLACGISGLSKYKESHMVNGSPDVFQSLIAQGEEELGITLDCANIHLIAVTRDLRFLTTQFIFLVHSDLHSSKITGGVDDWEYSSIKTFQLGGRNRLQKLMGGNLTYNLKVSLNYYQSML